MGIRTIVEKAASKIRELGRLTPMAIVSTFLPMLGSSLLIVFGYPIGNWMRANQESGSVVFVLGVLIFCGFAIIPTNLIGILSGWAFGFTLGLLLLMSGVVGAAAISFFLNRSISAGKLTSLTSNHRRADAIHKALVNEGFWKTSLVITLIRASVAMPFAFTNFCLAAAHVPIRSYVIGTALGMLPRSASMVFVGAGLSELTLEGSSNRWLVGGSIAATIALLIVISILSRNALMRITNDKSDD